MNEELRQSPYKYSKKDHENQVPCPIPSLELKWICFKSRKSKIEMFGMSSRILRVSLGVGIRLSGHLLSINYWNRGQNSYQTRKCFQSEGWGRLLLINT